VSSIDRVNDVPSAGEAKAEAGTASRRPRPLLSTRGLSTGLMSSAVIGASLAFGAPAAQAFSGYGTPCQDYLTAPGTNCVHGAMHKYYALVSGFDYSNGGVCAGLDNYGDYKCTLVYGPKRYPAPRIYTSCSICEGTWTNPSADTDVHNHLASKSIKEYLWIVGSQ
jgi:hypothetical protein